MLRPLIVQETVDSTGDGQTPKASQEEGETRRKENPEGQLCVLGEQECKACAQVEKWLQKDPRVP